MSIRLICDGCGKYGSVIQEDLGMTPEDNGFVFGTSLGQPAGTIFCAQCAEKIMEEQKKEVIWTKCWMI